MKFCFRELLKGNKKNALISALMIISFFVLLPTFIKVIRLQMAPYSEDEVIITTISYKSEVNGGEHTIVGDLFQPSPKFGDKKYPAIIVCHPYFNGIGKENMNRWCVELAKRDFVVLSVDLPGNGMSTGEMDSLPREDFEPIIIKDGVNYLMDLDFVKGSRIGLLGLSYGGATVSLCAGVLDKFIDATVVLNGFTNFTNWLIEDILPDNDVDFTVEHDYIEIKRVEDKKVTKDNIKDWLKLYGIVKGNEENMKDLIIPGTTRLDREFLKKFDAVEQLPAAKNDSVLFIHGKKDKSFGNTNQSEQGHDVITNSNKKAYYLIVNDNHLLTDDSKCTSFYCSINFFEEKLKNVDLGKDWNSDFEKYSQERDIELTIAPVSSTSLFFECIFCFLLSLIPFFIIVSIIFHDKRTATNRAGKEEQFLLKRKSEKDFIDFGFGRASYYKTVGFSILSYVICFITIIGLSMGFFSDLIAGTLCASFYLVLYLTFYFLPDQAEVNLWNRLKSNEKQKQISSISNVQTKYNRRFVFFLITSLIIISALLGCVTTFLPKIFYQPFEQIITPMLFIGLVLLFGSILVIYLLKRRTKERNYGNNINWQNYALDKYQLLKNFVLGSAIFLNIMFQWTMFAFFMKFPFIIGPHSIYYLYAAVAITIFFTGIYLLTALFKNNVLEPKFNTKQKFARKVLVELLVVSFGLFTICIISFFSFYLLLNTTLFGNLVYFLIFVLAIIFLITSFIDKVCGEKGIFGIKIFVPLILFSLFAFFFHI